jgi:hypothetical protein
LKDYYDLNVRRRDVVVFNYADDIANYDRVYGYDFLGWTDDVGFSPLSLTGFLNPMWSINASVNQLPFFFIQITICVTLLRK